MLASSSSRSPSSASTRACRSPIFPRGARQLGFELCPAEVGPQLRLQYLNQPLGEFLHIAMAPIARYGGEPTDFTVANGGARAHSHRRRRASQVHHALDHALRLYRPGGAAASDGAGYPDRFDKDAHDLTKVARFESYRGFLFGSLNPDVPALAAHLGEATKIIDQIVDQSPEGLEVLRGASTYVYDGNWKLQSENGADGYHVSTVHWNYAATTNRRKQAAQPDNVRAMSASGFAKQ